MESFFRAMRQARVFDLAVPISHKLPVSANHAPFSLSLYRRHGDVCGEAYSMASEVLTMSCHTGTHIDAPAHVSRSGKLHGGVDAHHCQGWRGMKELGIETVPPLVTRGVLLDVAGYLGVEQLDTSHAISAAELQAVAQHQGIAIEAGDVVLVRTGWIRNLKDPAALRAKGFASPGPTGAAARWLAEQGVSAVGADNNAFEHFHPEMTDLEGHMTLLVDHGIPILEYLDLEELSAQRVNTFLFLCAPLKLEGATGSPVRPLAIVPSEL